VAVVFILFVALIQGTVLLLAHQAAEVSVAAAARRVALGRQVADAELAAELVASVPGAAEVEARVDRRRRVAAAWARIAIRPPGPIFGAVAFEVSAEVPVVVAP